MEGREGEKEKEGRKKTRRGRPKKVSPSKNFEDKKKFLLDYSKDLKGRALILKLMEEVNAKSYGRQIELKEVVDIALGKIAPKDVDRLQKASLGEMDRVRMELDRYNHKHQTTLDLGEFLVLKLKLK